MDMQSESPIPYNGIFASIWSKLDAASEDHAHPMRACTLATTDLQGHPDARTVILRGFDRERPTVWFHTDLRAQKVAHIRAQPNVCAVLYDQKDGVQLRVYGPCIIRTDDQVADQHWEQIDMVLKYVYGYELIPGTERVHDPKIASHQNAIDQGNEEIARRNFAVIEMTVTKIEWLQIGTGNDHRAVLSADDGWKVRRLVP